MNEVKPVGSMTIQEQFERFHTENPHVYRLLLALARVVHARGRKKYGIQTLIEKLRWDHDFETRGEFTKGFKISNDYGSRYARKIMTDHPEMDGLFATSRLRTP